MIKIPIFAHIIKKNKVIPTSKPSNLSINTHPALLVRKQEIYGTYAWWLLEDVLLVVKLNFLTLILVKYCITFEVLRIKKTSTSTTCDRSEVKLQAGIKVSIISHLVRLLAPHKGCSRDYEIPVEWMVRENQPQNTVKQCLQKDITCILQYKLVYHVNIFQGPGF